MAQHATGFGIGLRRLKLKTRTVEFFRHRRGHGKARRQPVGAGRGHAAFQELAAAPPRADTMWAGHGISPVWLFSRLRTSRSKCLAPGKYAEPARVKDKDRKDIGEKVAESKTA